MSAPSLLHELALADLGGYPVAGVDEAGRGAWAGPVMAAAVILPLDDAAAAALRGVNDSKQLSARRREQLRSVIERVALACGIGSAGADEIDRLGIVHATRLAMLRAIERLSPRPRSLVIDALRLPELDLPQRAFYFADAISLSVAAASVLAKTERDRLMAEADAHFAGYGFGSHKGYGTRAHAIALDTLGACAIHRFSFAPLRQRRLLP